MTYSYIRCVVDGAWLTVTWRLAEHRVLGWWRGRLEKSDMTGEQIEKEVGPWPYICPVHPAAQIRKTWDQNHYVLNGYPAGTGWKTGIRFECAECGRRLAAE